MNLVQFNYSFHSFHFAISILAAFKNLEVRYHIYHSKLACDSLNSTLNLSQDPLPLSSFAPAGYTDDLIYTISYDTAIRVKSLHD